jgi:hypothetical protein
MTNNHISQEKEYNTAAAAAGGGGGGGGGGRGSRTLQEALTTNFVCVFSWVLSAESRRSFVVTGEEAYG